jgi:hypothetical protein
VALLMVNGILSMTLLHHVSQERQSRNGFGSLDIYSLFVITKNERVGNTIS